jgi:pyruvate dehydrogenase E1 component alpha subunit
MQLNGKKQTELYRTMFTIRRVEERLNDLFAKNLFPGYIHSYLGQEACATGVCGALRQDDYIFSTHRARGHLIAKGTALKPMMAEMWGKASGICQGRSGEMHVSDPTCGILASDGIVGGGVPMAVGAAYAAQVRGSDQVTAVFFGEGAANTGGCHEAMNMAAAWNLPILFVLENNLYMEMTPIRDVVKTPDLAVRAKAYDFPGSVVDGNDVLEVHGAVQKAVTRARKGEGPSLLELKTYRWGGHFQGDPARYRTREEEQAWKAKCPVKRMREHLLGKKVLSSQALSEVEKEVENEVEAAIVHAQESAAPDPQDALKHVYAP